MKGTVKWFSSEKGYGFITSEANDDHYYRVNDVNGLELPAQGDVVEFRSHSRQKGMAAEEVSLLEKSSTASTARRDDRINCHKCGKTIVPRVISKNGAADHSVCPFCGAFIETFSPLWKLFGWIINNILKRPILLIPIATFFVWIIFSNS